ncbi:nucleotide exchange factor GrpE [Haloarchaeobius sp. TZWSO28]|uniref:nucleotide exchange factor GrpE n=1 Tax=Haloarchaeobius sp. TZWSO28 TaxID=3446119 RepID=UPI003EBA4673
MDEDEDTETPPAEATEAAEDAPEDAESAPVDAPEQATGDAETETAADTAASDGDADDDSEDEFEWTESAAPETDAETVGETQVGDDLVDRITALDEELGSEVETIIQRAFELKDEAETLRETVDELEAERDELREEREDLKQRLVRKQADFKNYKERSKKKQEQIKERATEDLVERVVPVRDNLVRALDQDEGADIRDGIQATLREFDRVLEDENVEEVSPEPGTEVDPQRHEVMVRVDSDKPDGSIVDVYRPGYEMGGKVIQTAQVTVSNGSDYEGEEEAVPLGGEVEEGSPETADSTASDGGEVGDTAEQPQPGGEESGETVGEKE